MRSCPPFGYWVSTSRTTKLKTKDALNQEYPERREQVFWVFRGLPDKRKEQSEHQKTKDPPFGNQTHFGTPLRRSFRPPLFSFSRFQGSPLPEGTSQRPN